MKGCELTNKQGVNAHRPSTPPHLYDERYFLTACEGYQDFAIGSEAISLRLATLLELASPGPGERILDLGCGRGEATAYCAREGAITHGVDSSLDALHIAQRRLGALGSGVGQRASLFLADVKYLPFADASFDKVLMLDLVEHLYPWELAEALREAWRVLAAGGRLVIHTAPNRWYYRFGYPLYRVFERLRGRHLPLDPRSRFPFHHLHVNEQDIVSLRRSLQEAGFDSRVWLANIQRPLLESCSMWLNLAVRMLLAVPPFHWVFRNDILALAVKRGKTMRFTGERLVLGIPRLENMIAEELARLNFVCPYFAGKDVLDAGCGIGHGTHFLATHGARRALGVDISSEAVLAASESYRQANLAFGVMDCTQLGLQDESFDMVCSLELIEHLVHPEQHLAEICRVLRPPGIYFMSTPNRRVSSTPSGKASWAFHQHEFSLLELRELLEAFFEQVEIWGSSVPVYEQHPIRRITKSPLSQVKHLCPPRLRAWVSSSIRFWIKPSLGFQDVLFLTEDIEAAPTFVALCARKRTIAARPTPAP